MANVVQPRESALMAQMQQMMQQMMALNTGGGGRNHNNYASRGRGGGRGCGTQHNNRTTTARKYCWSHGACAHTGSECNTKATGHKNEATFDSMLGGSTRGCYWINT